MKLSVVRYCMTIGMMLCVAGCSTNISRFQMPGTDLSQVQTLFIRPLDEDREADKIRSLVEANLKQRGIDLAAGADGVHVEDGGYILDIAADWHWDITWYLLELRVAIYNPEDNTLVAQAQSQQTSLVRQSVEVIVERAMSSLFDDTDEFKGD